MSQINKHMSTNKLLEKNGLYLSMRSSFDGWNYVLLETIEEDENERHSLVVFESKDMKEIRKELLK